MSVDIVGEAAKTGTYTLDEMRPGSNAGDLSVAGFARKISYNVGETVQFCITGNPSSVIIFRMGYYGTRSARQITTIVNTPTVQPEASIIPGSNGATTCTGWSTTAIWTIPETAVSGLYVAMIRNATNDNAFYVTFVVRDDAADVDIIYKTSDTTWGAAYNYFGTKAAPQGGNVYGNGTGVGNITQRTYAVDYHRPVITRWGVQQTFWWACELPLIRFLERNGYSVKYISSEDLDREGSSILTKGKIFLSSGHDEYWTQPMWDAIEDWRDVEGGHSIFMSGNEVFWRARYVRDGDRATLWCYKDTMPGPTGSGHSAGQALDPVTWTGTWRDTRWPDRKPEWLLTGTSFSMNGIYDYDVIIPSNPYGGLKVWGGSSLNDQPVTLQQILGFEADRYHPTQPVDSVKILATYTRAAPGGLADVNGERYDVNGNIEWGIVSQRYASGALTVGFGTCQWSWALDDQHDRGSAASVSLDGQKFTVNLLEDLGANPATLMAGITLSGDPDLDAYGLVPSTPPPDPEPEEPVNNDSRWRFHDGSPATPYRLVNGELQEITGNL